MLEEIRLFCSGFTRAQRWVLALCALVIAIGCGVIAHNRTGPLPPLFEEAPAVSASERPVIKVDVSGAVRRPGVVEVAPDARVNDAVQAAGGAVPGADTDALNLAAHVQDGQKIVVSMRTLHT